MQEERAGRRLRMDGLHETGRIGDDAGDVGVMRLAESGVEQKHGN